MTKRRRTENEPQKNEGIFLLIDLGKTQRYKMGGYNSGGHNREHDYTSRQRRLDSFDYGKYVDLLKGESFATTVSWTDGSSIGTIIHPDRLAVAYRAGEQDIRADLFFASVSNNYGGIDKLYFKCPYCCRRSRILYMHQQHFKCRICARLNYRSQQMAHGWETSAYRLEKFLKSHFDVADISPYDAGYITPARPKGMHARTYKRLLQELKLLQAKQLRDFIERTKNYYL